MSDDGQQPLDSTSATKAGNVPLAVELNRAVVWTDTIHEGYIAAFSKAPWRSTLLLRSLAEGRATFKRQVACAVPLDPQVLPYNEGLVAFLKQEKQKGRRIGLFTATDTAVARTVADHLGLFDVVRGSEGSQNLVGARKLEAIREAFGPRFAYAGSSPLDRPIFKAAESLVLTAPMTKGEERAGKPVEVEFSRPSADLRTWARGLRLEHWAKNILIFVAPILGQQIASPRIMGQALLLFILMGVLASATYIINDLLDLAADRQHPRKRHRPFAAGKILARQGALAAGGLILVVLALSFALPLGCRLALVTYLGMTLSYSLILKRMPIVDIIVLAGLFTLRILAGSFLVAEGVSPWLLTFAMLFFLGLALVKRFAELERGVSIGGEDFGTRGYTNKDLPLLLTTGVSSGLGAIVIFTIYLINHEYPRGIYAHPQLLWMMMPILLLWTLRLWHLAVHGRMSEDPVVFALKDRMSLGLGALVVAVLIGASW